MCEVPDNAMYCGCQEGIKCPSNDTGVEWWGDYSSRAFGKIVGDIAQQPIEVITKSALLKAKEFTLFHRDGVIQSVTRV